MPLGMYDASIPVFVKMVRNVGAFLDKGKAHFASRNVDPAVLLATRLVPDMFALTEQIQAVLLQVTWACPLLAGQPQGEFTRNPQLPFDDLRKKIDETLAMAQTFTREQIDGSEDRPIKVVAPNGRVLEFKGQDYLQGFVLPNLYFHATMAYAILRDAGVDLGKRDFLA